MSPSAHVIRRQGARGARWHVRFRWRASDARARHFASFPREKDAKAALGWVMTEIAHGRFPEADRYFVEPTAARTLLEVHDAWADARQHEVGEAAHKQARQARAAYGALGAMDPAAITVADVRAWVAGLVAKGRAGSTIAAYRSVLRQALDAADLERPNPARDARVKLPRQKAEEGDPPSRAQYEAMALEISERHLRLLTFLEGTGLRIGEALAITWGDIDWREDLLRVRRRPGAGKTPAARRWVPLLAPNRRDLEDVPADTRAPGRPIFAGLTANSMRSAMRLASQKAGMPDFTPHDLRHRYTSLLVMAGVPAPLVGRIVGHARPSVTIDTYSHVLLDEPVQRLAKLRAAAFRIPGAVPLPTGDEAAPEAGGAYPVPGTTDEAA